MARKRKVTAMDELRRSLEWDISAAQSHIDLGEQLIRHHRALLAEIEAGTLEERLRTELANFTQGNAESNAKIEQAKRTLATLA